MKSIYYKSSYLLLAISLNQFSLYAQNGPNPNTVNPANISAAKNKNIFTIAPINKNTSASDFGGYSIGESLFFCSSQKQGEATYHIDGSAKSALYNLLKAEGQENKWKHVQVSDAKKRIHLGPICAGSTDGEVYVTADNDEMTGLDGKRMLKIYKAKLSASGKLTDFEDLPINSNDYSTGHPTLSADGKTLYFASDRPGGLGGVDLYKVAIKSDGTYGEVINLGKTINTYGNEFFPAINAKGQLFFSSDAHTSMGGLDIFVAYPSETGWKEITNLGETINSVSDDFAFVLGQDGQHGYFSSDRQGGKGSDDIYAFTMHGSLDLEYKIKGVVVDKQTNEPITGVFVSLVTSAGETISTVTSDSSGKFTFDVLPDNEYVVSSVISEYIPVNEPTSTKGMKNGDIKDCKVLLEKDPGLTLTGTLINGQSKKPEQGVNVKFIDNFSGEEVGTVKTDEKGNFSLPIKDKHLGDKLSYTLELSKEGYINSKQTINSVLDKSGPVNLNELVDMSMVKVDKGSDLGKLIDLKPIYFDYGKFDITALASAELDKIVKIMNENPKMVVELGSHTDSRGSAAANLKLSSKRAESSADYIRKRITNPERISGMGYGESRLLNNCADGTNCSEEQHAQNRRTEFVIKNL